MGSTVSNPKAEINSPARKSIVPSIKGVPMIRRLTRCSFLAILLVLVSLNSARAAQAQQTAGTSDEQVKERLSFVTNALYSSQPRAKTWWFGWIAGYSAGAIVQGVLAKAHWKDTKLDEHSQTVRDRDFAEDMLVGGVTAALGAGGLLINPFGPAYSPNKLRPMPEDTPEDRRIKLAEAEAILRQCAKREKEGRGWVTHLLNLGVNAAAGLVTVVAFDRPWYDGLLTFATSEAVSLLNIYSQPRRAIRDLNNYEVKYLGRQGAYLREPSDRPWYVSVYPGGLSVGIRF
jgi:hypothetical protein